MSRAFVKESDGEPWTAPETPLAYRVIWTGTPDHPEVLRETDDLLDALHWLSARPQPGFELRDAQGTLLAVLQA